MIPLSLPLGPCWELEEGRVDSTLFLRTLPTTFPEANAAFFEGSAMTSEVLAILKEHADPGEYLPEPQTWFSATLSRDGARVNTTLRLRCLFTPALCEALADASGHHAAPELFEHIFLYAGQEPLLEWPDAFSNCMWIARSIPEERVKLFAATLGLGYKYENPG